MEPKEVVAVVVATAFCRLVALINQTMQSKTEISKKNRAVYTNCINKTYKQSTESGSALYTHTSFNCQRKNLRIVFVQANSHPHETKNSLH
jgi:hypothetical protein